MPERQEGHLLKKRKWPLKGWHKVGWAGQRAGPDMREGWGSVDSCWAVLGVGVSRRKVHVCGCSLPTPFSLGNLGPVSPGHRYRGTLCLRMGSFATQTLGKM